MGAFSLPGCLGLRRAASKGICPLPSPIWNPICQPWRAMAMLLGTLTDIGKQTNDYGNRMKLLKIRKLSLGFDRSSQWVKPRAVVRLVLRCGLYKGAWKYRKISRDATEIVGNLYSLKIQPKSLLQNVKPYNFGWIQDIEFLLHTFRLIFINLKSLAISGASLIPIFWNSLNNTLKTLFKTNKILRNISFKLRKCINQLSGPLRVINTKILE